ncbi:aspartyl protease [Defluviimonas sp. 20V17]|uniref:Aspartyl protease n=1 Tax=Allgaiera indica TaxID=765699 RepID=A0AAN4USG5_9RHOB|nr:TIGR02281 family clan AA aspartic protease [Allgaiera indica]KDB01972.1 aspartyl protease [Defluviimonas sp. 20V17]GHE03323.1 aspartyl protease [Allgaiera indica]SDX23381.1 aspartyl protease family protein [Allgaiera indica]
MDGDTLARVTYLVLIAVAVGGALIAQGRGNWSKLSQQAAIWGLIFVGVIAGYGLWSDIGPQLLPRQEVVSDTGQIVLPRGPNGHFYATVKIDGTPVQFVVDTGATSIVLTKADARRLGLHPESLQYIGVADTANGLVRTAQVTLRDVQLGGLTVPSMRASVNDGRMEMSLLGMTFLKRFSKLEIAGNKMILTP